jgi:oligopeptide/dipeptide ABC transporter ATP-binding protein
VKGPAAAGVHPLLSVENLGVRFPSRNGTVRALNGVTFRLEAGRTLGLVGESGCGKSVLCRCLLRLLPSGVRIGPEARVVFDGTDLLRLKEKALNRIRGKEMAMVFQDPIGTLHPLMTVGRQVAEPLVHHMGAHPADARRKAVALLASVGIPTPDRRADAYPHQLSGGMRQRAAIAVALACGPRLLVADEPTTALDVTVAAEILDLLDRLQAARGMAMILVSHDLAVVAGRAHETAVMYAGRIVEQGPTEVLFQRPRMPYTRMLLDARPRLEDLPHTRLASIEGHLPDPTRSGAGCPFAPRCPRARTRCRETAPRLREAGEGEHRFACWYPEGEGG